MLLKRQEQEACVLHRRAAAAGISGAAGIFARPSTSFTCRILVYQALSY